MQPKEEQRILKMGEKKSCRILGTCEEAICQIINFVHKYQGATRSLKQDEGIVGK